MGLSWKNQLFANKKSPRKTLRPLIPLITPLRHIIAGIYWFLRKRVGALINSPCLIAPKWRDHGSLSSLLFILLTCLRCIGLDLQIILSYSFWFDLSRANTEKNIYIIQYIDKNIKICKSSKNCYFTINQQQRRSTWSEKSIILSGISLWDYPLFSW